MGFRLSKIYTRKGDDGTTSLDAHHRILKNNIRIETIGTIDELNSAIGLILSFGMGNKTIREALQSIQQDLFNLGGELCPPFREAITVEKVLQFENWIDEWNKTLPPLKEFILPGGNPASATCHLARTICRRAERLIVSLKEEETINNTIPQYINRLSDVLFVAARMLAKETQNAEILWEHSRKISDEKK